jgi:hypothetical protein
MEAGAGMTLPRAVATVGLTAITFRSPPFTSSPSSARASVAAQ